MGIVLGGALVGPFVLDWVAREGIVEALGALGLLYLMFLAGLELDLDEFERNRRPALTFGALTFTLPFVLGLLLVLPFGYGLATAALYGSLWASHTLLAYPIVQEHRLTRHRAVGMAAGGTVITDTLALFVLAVVVGSHGQRRPPCGDPGQALHRARRSSSSIARSRCAGWARGRSRASATRTRLASCSCSRR